MTKAGPALAQYRSEGPQPRSKGFGSAATNANRLVLVSEFETPDAPSPWGSINTVCDGILR